MLITVVVSTLVGTLGALLFLGRQRTTYQRVYVRPLAQRRWLFGFDIAFQLVQWISQGAALRKSTNWIEENGRTFSLRFAGHYNICTADGMVAKAVLTSPDFELSSVRQLAFRSAVGNGMLATTGAQAAHGRKVLRQALSQSRVRDLSTYEVHVQNLFSILPADGSTFDLKDALSMYAMDVTSTFLLGKSTFWLTNQHLESTKVLGRAIDYFLEVMRLRTDLGFFAHLHRDWKFNHYHKLLYKFVDNNIARVSLENLGQARGVDEERMKRTPHSFTHGLLAFEKDIETTRGHVLSTILVGRDSVASLTAFTIWILAKYPEIQHKLRGTIEGLDQTTFHFQHLSENSYLWWTIKEVLRLYPSTPANDRAARRDTYIPTGGGPDGSQPAFIPAGTVIDLHTYAIHRDRTVWGEDAHEFVPERWANGPHLSFFLPFGAGPRACPGQDLAMTATAYLVVRILQTYRSLESRDNQPFRELVSISLSSYHGFKVALRT